MSLVVQSEPAQSPQTYGRRMVAITPGAEDFPDGPAKAIQCMQEGDITFVPVGNADADTITAEACPVGFSPFARVRRVTAATGLWVAVYD
jgi:hypothetical protein